MLDTKKVMLSDEPPLGDEKAITIVVRMPNGGRCERRFLRTDKLQVKMVLKNISSQSYIFELKNMDDMRHSQMCKHAMMLLCSMHLLPTNTFKKHSYMRMNI